MLTNEVKQNLVEIAVKAREKAYAPYSNYPVGAALLTNSGKIYEGVNIENAAFPVTMCAERVAVFKAISEGEYKFEAIAVATVNGGTPCGYCRQVMAEFGLGTAVLIANSKGKLIEETDVAHLLPGAFQPENLVSED